MAGFYSGMSGSDVPVALIMLAIGFHTETSKLTSVLSSRHDCAAFYSTLLSTVLLVPCAAFAIALWSPGLSAESVHGIVIVSILLPGGPLANIAAVITGANKELNVLLTSVEMVLSGLLVPVGLLIVLPHIVASGQLIRVPYAEQAHGIAIVVVPLLVGLCLSYMAPSRPGMRQCAFRLLAACALAFAVAPQAGWPCGRVDFFCR